QNFGELLPASPDQIQFSRTIRIFSGERPPHLQWIAFAYLKARFFQHLHHSGEKPSMRLHYAELARVSVALPTEPLKCGCGKRKAQLFKLLPQFGITLHLRITS